MINLDQEDGKAKVTWKNILILLDSVKPGNLTNAQMRNMMGVGHDDSVSLLTNIMYKSGEIGRDTISNTHYYKSTNGKPK